MALEPVAVRPDGYAASIVAAIERVLAEPELRTGDLGGKADTATCGKAIADALG